MGDDYWDFWQSLSYIPNIRVCRDPSSKRILAILLSYVGTWLSDELCGSRAQWLSEYPVFGGAYDPNEAHGSCFESGVLGIAIKQREDWRQALNSTTVDGEVSGKV